MDLLVGAKKIIVATTHLTKEGNFKLVKECTYPLTATRSVDLIVTDYATFSVKNSALVLEELMEGITIEQLYAATEAPFELGNNISVE